MIKLVAVGRCKEKAMLELIGEYSKRLQAYTKWQIIEVTDEKTVQTNSVKELERIKEKEGDRILEQIKEDAYVILLDLRGEMLSSEQLAQKLDKLFLDGNSTIIFVIGGSLGVSKAVRERAQFVWAFSELTFPHQLMRVMLTEQIYRAFTILHHTPYHK